MVAFNSAPNREPSLRVAGNASRAEARLRFLDLRHLPASCTYEEAGWLLGQTEEEVGILVGEGHLHCLGDPPPNGKKHLLTEDVLVSGADAKWLHKSFVLIRQFWKRKNQQTQQKKQSKN
jgi:hypothetical protein